MRRKTRRFSAGTDRHSAKDDIATAIILLLITIAPLIATWNFHWYGNPDQDLVFLRDGVRLSNGYQPIYTEHPGALQAFAVASSRIFTSTARLIPSPAEIPTEADYQTIFQYTKTLNLLAYGGIIGFTYCLLRRLIGKHAAFTWSLLTVLSAGYIVEIVQLRNEVYSALLFYLAGTLIAVRYSQARKAERITADIGIASMYIFSCTLSVFSKVQSLPLFALLDTGLVLWLASKNQESVIQSRGYLWKQLCLALLVGIIGSVSSSLVPGTETDVTGLTARAVSIAILIFPITGTRCKKDKTAKIVLGISLITFVVLIAGLSSINIGWFNTALNPLASHVHTHGAKNCETAMCLVDNARAGILLLFKRTISNNTGASTLGALCLSYFVGKLWHFTHNKIYKLKMATISIVLSMILFDTGFGFSGKVAIVSASISGSIACELRSRYFSSTSSDETLSQLLFWSSMIMAIICSLRWPVDHYLAYQQPLLFGSIIIETLRIPPRYLIGCTLLFLVSLTSIQIDILQNLRVTYQQHLDKSSNQFCAPQHQGQEWSKTFISELECNKYESIDAI